MAPEIITGDKQTYAIDLWSYGILIYEIIAGEAPFKGDSPKGILKSVLNNTISMPDKFSEDARDLICRLLSPNPKDRIGSKGSSEIKNHSFFKSIDWGRIEAREYPAPYIPQLISDSDVLNLPAEDLDNPVDKTYNQSKQSLIDGNLSNFYFNANDCSGAQNITKGDNYQN